MPPETTPDSAAEQAVNAVAEEGKKKLKKAAMKAIWEALAPFLPEIAIGLAILFFVIIIALIIVGYVNKNGSAGVSAHNNSTALTEQKTLAKSGDPTARAQTISLSAENSLTNLDALGKKLTSVNDQTNLSKLKDLESNILALTTNAPGNTVSIDTIQKQVDDLKQSLGPNYNNDFVNIQNSLDNLKQILTSVSSAQLVINGDDLYYIRTHQVDERVLEALNYLITPTAQGGAGFRKITVQRIKSGYDTDNEQYSQEWSFSSDADRSISPHFYGQAMDISGIDMADRSLYKKSIAKSKREIQSPVDILVSYQSNVPGQTLPGSSATSTGSSLGTLSNNQALTDLFTIIGQNSGIDLSQYNLAGATLPEIAKTMGIVALDQQLSLKIDSQDDNSTEAKFLENIGRSYVANQFSLPKQALVGSSSEEVQTNIGRETLAQRMKLAPLSLTGSSSNQLFYSVGKRKVEKSFGLRASSLDNLPLGGDFTSFLGELLIEEKLNLQDGTFSGNDLNQIAAKININGDNRFATLFSNNPDQVDSLLDLPADPDSSHANHSYTYNLINGIVSVDAYRKAVGQVLIDTFSSNFHPEQVLDLSSAKFFGGCGGGYVDVGGVCLASSGATYDKQDEAWDMPDGSIQSVLSNSPDAFYNIGIDEVAKRLVDDTTERSIMKLWLTDPGLKSQSLDNLYFYNTTLTSQDFLASQCLKVVGQTCIKTLDQIQNPNHTLVDSINQQIVATQKNINGEQGVDNDQAASLVTEFQNTLNILLEELLIAGGLQTDGSGDSNTKYAGNASQWLPAIVSDSINSALGLPVDGINLIFRQDQGDPIFYALGGSKIDSSDHLYDPNALALSSARTTFYNNQIDNFNDQITQLQSQEADLQTRKANGETGLDAQIQSLDTQIKTDQRAVTDYNNQARLEQTNNAEIQASLNNAKLPTKDSAIKLEFSKFSDINYDLGAVFQSLGAQKIESDLNLPTGSLTSIFDYTQTESPEIKYLEAQREKAYQSLQDLESRKSKGETGLDSQIALQQGSVSQWDKLISQQRQADGNKSTATIQTNPTIIGKKQIEQSLGLPMGSYGGNTVDDLINRLGGEQNTYNYFAKGFNFADIQKTLPLTDDTILTFKTFLKNTDALLNLADDTTYDLFAGNITPDKYAEDVGSATLLTRTVNTLGTQLGLNVGSYALTGSDVTSLLNGDYLAVLLKVGAKNIDQNIQLPLGTVKAMIDNPSTNCQVTDPKTGLQQSCIENLLVANGEVKLGKFLGLVGDATMSDDQAEIFGQEQIEETLNKLCTSGAINSACKSFTLPGGWFKGSSLSDIALNIAYVINPDMNNELILFQNYNNDGENKLLQKFGFNPSDYSLDSLTKDSFTQGSTSYSIAKTIDTALNIAVGTTAQLFQQKMTVQDYELKIQKGNTQQQTDSWIFSQFPSDIRNYLTKRNISMNDLKGYYAKSQDPESQALLSAFLGAKEDYAVDKAEDDLVLGQFEIESKLDTFKDDWFMGKSIDAIVLGILLDKSKTVKIPDGLRLILALYQNNPNLEKIKSDLAANPQNAKYITYVDAAEQEFLGAFGFPKNKYTEDDLRILISGQVPAAKALPVTSSDTLVLQSADLDCDSINTLMQTKYSVPLLGLDTSLDQILAYYKSTADQQIYYDTWLLQGTPSINDAHTYIRSASTLGSAQPVFGCSLNLSSSSQTNLASIDDSTPHTILASSANLSIDPSQEVATITNKIDDRFHITEGTTEKFLGKTISPDQYKDAVKKAFTNYEIGDVAVDALLPNKIQTVLNEHDISIDDLKNVLNDPDQALSKIMLNFLPPAETGIVLGLIGNQVPLKGEFGPNFAQKQIEELLGLTPGTFSPNTSIYNVMSQNTPTKFAASFRIDFDRSLNDSQVQSLLINSVFNPNSDYWKDPFHQSRTLNIDSILKINNIDPSISSDPTRDLLTGKMTVSQYIELVRENEFDALDPTQFFSALISVTANGGSDERKTKYAQYLAGASIGFNLLQNPNSLRDPSTQLGILNAFKSVAGIDLDDKAGFSAGTFENLILHPGDAESILFAQGLQSVASKNFFGDAEPYKKDLLMLFQYYLPPSISNPLYFASIGQSNPMITTSVRNPFTGKITTTTTGGGNAMDPNNGNNCLPPTQEGYKPNMTAGDSQNFITQHRTLCGYQIVDVALHDFIKQSTVVSDKNGNMIPGGDGIDVPLSDISLLEQGDLGVLTNIGLAYAVNKVRAEQDNDGNNLQLIPPDFNITYSDIKAALNPSSEEKQSLQNTASLQYAAAYTIVHSEDPSNCIKSGPYAGVCGGADNSQRIVPGSCTTAFDCEIGDNPNYKPEFDNPDIVAGEKKAMQESVPNAKKDLEYRYMDAQLMSVARANDASSIPPGFTKTMLTGTDQERSTMLLAYAISNLLIDKNADKVFGDLAQKNPLAADFVTSIKNALNTFVSTKNVQGLENFFTTGNGGNNVVADPLYMYCDTFLAQKLKDLGLNVSFQPSVNGQMGLSEAILLRGYAALGGNISQGTLANANNYLNNAGKDFTISLVSQFLDKKLGLKPGTAQGMYNIYKAYRAASAANNAYTTAALAASTAAQAATSAENAVATTQASIATNQQIIDDPFAAPLSKSLAQDSIDTDNAALPAEQQTLDTANATKDSTSTTLSASKLKSIQAKATVITLAVQLALFAFSDQLAIADQKLNLPPGSVSSILSFAASTAIYETFYVGAGTAAGTSAASAAAAGVWIAAAFMVYNIVFGFNKVEYQITCPGDYTFTSWCTETNSLYTQWAQDNVHKLINDMLLANDRIKQNNLFPNDPNANILPTIMGTFRTEDYDYFNGISPEGTDGDLISKYYGSSSLLRGVKGLYQSDYMESFVHIGY